MEEVYYICDPRKNPDCPQTSCWYKFPEASCYQTRKEECSTEKSRWQILAELRMMEEDDCK